MNITLDLDSVFARCHERFHYGNAAASRYQLADGRAILDIRNFGDQSNCSRTVSYLEKMCGQFSNVELSGPQAGWGAWFGKYEAALAAMAREIEQNREVGTERSQERWRDRSRGCWHQSS